MASQSAHNYLFPWFIALVLGLLALDLLLMNRGNKTPTIKQAGLLTLFWVSVASLFGLWITRNLGVNEGLTFLTGYVIELSLSIDNLFVFILIFSSYKVAEKYQHRVLFWGILGALVMRAICIFAGVAALQRFAWLEFIFAAILVMAGVKSIKKRDDDEEDDPTQGWVASTVSRLVPFKNEFVGDRFFVIENGKYLATPLFLVLVLVEISDVIFAVDSIPAVLSITKDTFLIYSSNIFAVLGLRSMYFVLSRMVSTFRFLDTGVGLILVFIGIKMGIGHWIVIPIEWALGTILGILSGSIVLSLIFPHPEDPGTNP
jgi:tellurite resistance protein TerC